MMGSFSPARVGDVLFQVFFSLAFFVVMLAGPAVAANSIASEREGRTWEALQLTGLPPGVVARGKFLAAYTNVALYIVMMSPIGALPFLFGGVTATETVAAFLWLFVFAGLGVAFGLAISSKMESLRAAILVTLFVSLLLVPNSYLLFGVGGSTVAHEAWSNLPKAHPVWLPIAYARAPPGWEYLGALVLGPLLGVALPSWFLYEITTANLTSITDDRSSGVRRWFLASSAALTACGVAVMLSVEKREHGPAGLVSLCVFFLFLTFCVFVFAGEPIGPSRRVLARWQGAGFWGRALGPGVMKAAKAVLLAGAGGVAVLTASTVAAVLVAATRTKDIIPLVTIALYGLGFLLFLTGFAAWVRARVNSVAMTRVIVLVVLFLVSAGPWVVAAIIGAISSTTSKEELMLAAPSPLYPIVVVDELHRSHAAPILTLCAVTAAAWALLGLGLFGAASLRCARIIRDHDKALAESDAFLQAEDGAARGGP